MEDDRSMPDLLPQNEHVYEALDYVWRTRTTTELRSFMLEAGASEDDVDEFLDTHEFTWRQTEVTEDVWHATAIEYLIDDHGIDQERFVNAIREVTDHVDCNEPNGVRSALSRRTFFEGRRIGDEYVQQPSTKVIWTILNHVVDRIEERSDVTVEEIASFHDRHTDG